MESPAPPLRRRASVTKSQLPSGDNVSPRFLDISARSAKVEFAEVALGNAAEPAGNSRYLPSAGLQLWSIDEAKALARAITALEWAIQAGVLLDIQVGDDSRSEPSPSDSSDASLE